MGCSQPCEGIPPLLEDPTENELMLWHFATRPCIEFDDPCRVGPLLDNATGCEAALLAYLKEFSGCRLLNGCSGIPSFAPELNCPPNLTNMIEFVERTRTPEGGEGGGGGAAPVCGDTGQPLAISCLDPNDIGAGSSDCSIRCDVVLPEIRFTANGGVRPYTWSLVGACSGGYGGVGGPSFGGPVADGICDSRFVVTAPTNVGSASLAFTKIWARCCVGFDGTNCTGSGAIMSLSTQNIRCDGVKSSCVNQGINTTCSTQDKGCGLKQYCGDAGGAGGDCSGCEQVPIDADLKELCDRRSQAAIDAGCAPCELCFETLVVTVTDAVGTQVSQTVTVD